MSRNLFQEETVVPKNFVPFYNGTTFSSRPRLPMKAGESVFDILLDPENRNRTENRTNTAINQMKAIFRKMDRKVALPLLFRVTLKH